MFEEVCLVCGKYLLDDGRAYCSDDCQSRDSSSPSISSSSSALSSPQLGYAYGGEVPVLVPSALGSALKSYASCKGNPYVSSSSASSTSWSVITDDEEEDTSFQKQPSDYYAYQDTSEPVYDPLGNPIKSSALCYTRRPSGTNNRSTVPNPHLRLGSASAPKYSGGAPRSAPIQSHSSADEGDLYSDVASFPGDVLESDSHELSEKIWDDPKPKYPTSKTNRNRNRASLPAYFSLLQVKSPSKVIRPSPVSSSSGTIARPSPPTPKLTQSTRLSQAEIVTVQVHSTLFTTPRGRRREADKSCSSRSARSSPSPSRSRSRRLTPSESPRPAIRHYAKNTEQLAETSSDPPSRGRTALRRNSSPSPVTIMGAADPSILSTAMTAKVIDRSSSHSRSRPRTRGRVGIENLGGLGYSTDAPGYGNGRSGLMNRERAGTSQLTRIPL